MSLQPLVDVGESRRNSVVDVRSHRGGAGRGRADLPDGAGKPVPVRATTRRSLCGLSRQTAAAGPGAPLGKGVRLARPRLIPFWRRSSK